MKINMCSVDVSVEIVSHDSRVNSYMTVIPREANRVTKIQSYPISKTRETKNVKMAGQVSSVYDLIRKQKSRK